MNSERDESNETQGLSMDSIPYLIQKPLIENVKEIQNFDFKNTLKYSVQEKIISHIFFLILVLLDE
jgi:hypothetical protein